MVDSRGEAPRIHATNSALGFYCNDTRYLSIWETTVNGGAGIPLAHELRFGGNTLVLSMTNRDLPALGSEERIPRDTFLIRRILTLVEDQLFEILAIRNFAQRPHTIQLEQWIGTRHDDLFEVRGFPRHKRGRQLAPEEFPEGDGRVTVLQTEGLDSRIRKTFVQQLFPAEKIRLSPGVLGSFSRVEIPAKGDALFKTQVSFDRPTSGRLRGQPFAALEVTQALDLIAQPAERKLHAGFRIETDNAIVNRSIENARMDLHMLLTLEGDHVLYPYAGIPWFSAPFGRDGILTAYQMLPWHPTLARGVLDYVFQTLGTRRDDFTDEQPGKVFHELRRGEMAATREIPFIPYYGSVDATPLALILLHEYVAWTLDLERLREWWPAALRALEWIERWGDPAQDGFLQYAQLSPRGLINQGWKDSHDSIMHRDGALAVAPIRLCEVQGYAFRARVGMSALARLLGYSDLSQRLRLDALQLRSRFIEHYWDAARGSIHLALDRDLRPCEVLSSNMGHCLWSGILDPTQAESVGGHLMSPALFSGHGIRTLADTELAYNPLSYHNGSVWPHDNSITLEGFRNYNQLHRLETLAQSMIGVLESSDDFRLPELFCGFRKRGNEPPIPYEVACKPQAWAAGSIFLMLKSMLGLSMDTDQSHVVFHSPLLTQRIQWMDIHGLTGRDWEMDVMIRRGSNGTSVDVQRRHGQVRVLTVK